MTGPNWKERVIPAFMGAAMCAMWAGDLIAPWVRREATDLHTTPTTTTTKRVLRQPHPRPYTGDLRGRAGREAGNVPGPKEATTDGGDRITQSTVRPAIYNAIRRVESGGNDYAVGDGGASRGPYQISRAYWRDACEYGGLDWDYDKHVWNRARCEYVMYLYWQRYGAETPKERARIHNGGPDGAQQDCTLGYWRKIKSNFSSTVTVTLEKRKVGKP